MTHLVTKKQPTQHCDKCNKYFADLEVLPIAIIFLLIKLIFTFLEESQKIRTWSIEEVSCSRM